MSETPTQDQFLPTPKESWVFIPKSNLVELGSQNDVIRGELVQVIAGWLIDQGLTSSAQLLRDEATTLLRQEHNERKALRAVSRAIHEGNWDTANAQIEKLTSLPSSKISSGTKTSDLTPASPLALLLQSMPFLLAEQQFLEYIDEDDGHRAHGFFMRRLKPFEGIISKEYYQQLIYLLTCRTVSEAGGMFPRWRGWTPMAGRAQLQSLISRVIGHCESSPYCRQNESETGTRPGTSPKSLEQIVSDSLSYELLKSRYPSLLQGFTTQTVMSIFEPLADQFIPSNHIASIDVNKLIYQNTVENVRPVQLTACQPFLEVPAVVVGTHTGSIFWIPIDGLSTGLISSQTRFLLYQYGTPVHGMESHGRQILLSWSGCQSVVINIARFAEKTARLSSTADYLSELVANTFTHPADVYSCCLFPCGYILAAGLSEGTVTVWDLLTGGKMLQNNFSASAITSLVASRSGSCYFAASKEGVIRVVDITTSVLLYTFASPVSGEVCSMALSPSSSLLLVSYRSGMLRLWDALTGNLLPYRFEGVDSATCCCANLSFGRVDTHIVSGGDDGYLYLWDLAFTSSHMDQECSLNSHVKSTPQESTINDLKHSSGIMCSSLPGRYYWSVGKSTKPPIGIRLHRSRITDLKFQQHYVVTCGDDGMVCLCSSMPQKQS